MAEELVEILDIDSTAVTVANTTVLTSLFSTTIDGGTLAEDNRFRWQMQATIGFAGQNHNCTLWMVYAGVTVASCIVKNIAAGARSNIGLRVDAELSGDGSVNSQFGTMHSFLGLPRSEDGSTPIGSGTVGGASGGDQTFAVKAQWASASASNTITHKHSTSELLSFVEDEVAPDLDEPTAYIFLDSKLNRLHYNTRKYAYFYAPLEYELAFYGYGDVTFTRASTSTATWRDGASHALAVDEPRFEYTGQTVSGLKISTATETLVFDSSNTLNDGNTLCYVLNGVFKSTRRGDTNPFSGSQLTGLTNSYITQIVKFNKVLAFGEDQQVELALTT